MADVGGFFSGVGEGIHEVLFTVTKGLEDIMNSMFDSLGQGVNALVSLLNESLHKIYAASGGRLGEPPDANMSGVDIDMTKQKIQQQLFLNNLFSDLDPNTGKPWAHTGGGETAPRDALGTTTDYGLWAASGGTLRYVGPKMGGSGAGTGGGTGGTPDLSVRGLGSMPDMQAAMATAQRAYKDAMDRFDIDLSKHKADLSGAGAQSLLKGDISTIIKDMVPLLGYDSLDVQKAQQDLLGQIAGSTAKTAAPGAAFNPLSDYRMAQQASYGGAIFSFAASQHANLSEQVRQLLATQASDRATIANLTAQLAAMKENNGTQKQVAQHAAATATHTKRFADAASKPATSLGQVLRSGGVALHPR